MAKIKNYIGELSGKLGGMIFARNKGGSYVKNWVKPINPRTTAQSTARASFTAQVTGWHALTDLQKAGWNTFAANYFSPKYAKEGVSYSGFNAYVSLNNQLKMISINGGSGALQSMTATYAEPPIYNSTAPALALSGKIQIDNAGPSGEDLETAVVFDYANWDKTAGNIDLSFRVDGEISTSNVLKFRDPHSGEQSGIIVMSSLPGTQTQEFGKNPKYRLLGNLPLPTVTAGPATPTRSFTVRFAEYDLGYKYQYAPDQAVTLSAFLYGSSGQTVFLGSQRVVLG